MFFLVSCTTKDRSSPWQDTLAADSYIAIDVRTKREAERNPAAGSLNIPMKQLSKGIQKLDKSKTILLFCELGVRANRAKEALKKDGFEKVVNIGSWREWNEFYEKKQRDAKPSL